MLKFKGIQKTTLIDYPNEVAATLFLSGCNFRCSYCYNPSLVFNSDTGVEITEDEALDFLRERKWFLDGVCITGGEPLMHYPDIAGFLKKVKELGYKVKLDTNGSYPEALLQIIDQRLVDYIAMDIKAPLEKYEEITNAPVNTVNIKKSIELIKNSGVKYEFRTTVSPELEVSDFEKISCLLSRSEKYFLQQLKTSMPLVDSEFPLKFEPLSLEDLQEIAGRIGPSFDAIAIRN